MEKKDGKMGVFWFKPAHKLKTSKKRHFQVTVSLTLETEFYFS